MPVDPSLCGPWGLPFTALVYGETGDGKTFDLGLLGHNRFAYIGEPKHLKTVATASGHTMDELWICEARFVEDVTELLPTVADAGYDGVGIDDLSLLCEATFARFEANAPVGASGAKDGFYAHVATQSAVVTMRRVAAELGLHIAWNAHKAKPDTDSKGQPHKGGPKMPNRNLRASIPVIADLTITTEKDPTRKPGWPVTAICDPANPNWHMRDRHGFAPARGPLNLAEVLRLGGYTLPRRVELEAEGGIFDGEAAVQTVAEELLKAPDGKAMKAAWPELRDWLIGEADGALQGAGYDGLNWETWRETLTYWLGRDAWDRACIRRARRGARLALLG